MAATKNTKTAVKTATKTAATKRPSKKIDASITLTKSAATAILAPYRESDNVKARKVVSLMRYVGKGHTADSIIRDTLTVAADQGLTVPSGFRSTEVGLALSVARTMASIEISVTASARDAIAAALVDISRASKTNGGGQTGVTAALALAIDGTDNGAIVAERLVTAAQTITDTENAARRARQLEAKTRAARPITPTDDDTDDAPEPKGKTGQTAVTEAVGSLADVTLARLIHELDARIVAGYVPTLAEQAAFDQLASNWEDALATVDA